MGRFICEPRSRFIGLRPNEAAESRLLTLNKPLKINGLRICSQEFALMPSVSESLAGRLGLIDMDSPFMGAIWEGFGFGFAKGSTRRK